MASIERRGNPRTSYTTQVSCLTGPKVMHWSRHLPLHTWGPWLSVMTRHSLDCDMWEMVRLNILFLAFICRLRLASYVQSLTVRCKLVLMINVRPLYGCLFLIQQHFHLLVHCSTTECAIMQFER